MHFKDVINIRFVPFILTLRSLPDFERDIDFEREIDLSSFLNVSTNKMFLS